jgi:SAM-dependent methyltransferase
MGTASVNFDRELQRNDAYDRSVGVWWEKRTYNAAHVYAYRNIVRYIANLRRRKPQTIVDYACGSGAILTRLVRQFPKARVIGIDGSAAMLAHIKKRLNKLDKSARDRVELIQTTLPDFSLEEGIADLVVFTFPNILATNEQQPYYDKHGYKRRNDQAVARLLSKAREPDPEDETVTDKPEELFDTMMSERVVARNLRKIVHEDGILVRSDYSGDEREDLTELVQARFSFEDGSLGIPYLGKRADQLFAITRSKYFRSRVIEDVYHQTKDESDNEGGYCISVLAPV